MAKKARTPGLVEFVLDGSVALAWYFKDEADAYADAVAAHLPSARAIVPQLWHLEVANALLMGESRQQSTEAQAAQWLTYLRLLPITVDDETSSRAWGEVLNLARNHRLSAFDAASPDFRFLTLHSRCYPRFPSCAPADSRG